MEKVRKIKRENVNGINVVVSIKCKTCNERYFYEMQQSQYESLKKGYGKLQDVLPHLSPDEREIFASGICGTCWDVTFGESL